MTLGYNPSAWPLHWHAKLFCSKILVHSLTIFSFFFSLFELFIYLSQALIKSYFLFAANDMMTILFRIIYYWLILPMIWLHYLGCLVLHFFLTWDINEIDLSLSMISISKVIELFSVFFNLIQNIYLKIFPYQHQHLKIYGV